MEENIKLWKVEKKNQFLTGCGKRNNIKEISLSLELQFQMGDLTAQFY